MQVLLDKVMRDSSAYSNRGLSAPRRIPREANARIEVLVVGRYTRFAVEAGIAGVSEAWRRVGNYRAFLVRVESGEAEVIQIALRESHRQERLPAKAVGHCEFRVDLPCILRVKA